MGKLEKVILIILSLVIFVFAILTIVSDFVAIDYNMFGGVFSKIIFGTNKYIISGILIIISIVGLSVDAKGDDTKKCVNIQSEKGILLITKNTFEEIALSVVRQTDKVKNMKAVATMKEVGININVYIYVLPQTNITELSIELQDKIKTAINKLTTIEVNNVNILVKGIYQENRI